MSFLVGWGLKLGALGLVCLVIAGSLQLKLPASVLGYDVPREVREAVDRTGVDLAGRTQAGIKAIADAIK